MTGGGFLGIDIGGTASRWILIDAEGAVVGRGQASGATGHLFNPAERARFETTIGAIAEALPGPALAVHLGVTGLGVRAVKEATGIVALLLGVPREAVGATDDMELAFRGAFAPGEGHLVSAGTGSIGLHITAEGEVIRVGGRGILIDDGGSGSWIALTALDRLYRLIDENGGPAGAGRLHEAIASAVGGSAWDDVRAFIYGGDRGRIGELAKAVAAAADAGDPMALAVLSEAAVQLVRLARALIRRAGQRPVAFVGGVLGLHPVIGDRIREALADCETRFPRIDAALSAALMARDRGLAGR